MARILVAEDNPGVRRWLAEVLSAAGHGVSTARDGLEAKRLAKRKLFDLIVTDICMPNEDGLGLIRFLQKTHPQIKILAISGKDPETLIDAILLGAHAALPKPLTAAAVLECVCKLSPSQIRV
jgi:two-component system response regulator AtoC